MNVATRESLMYVRGQMVDQLSRAREKIAQLEEELARHRGDAEELVRRLDEIDEDLNR